jgi:V/A-type H+-transporting ATPase subunit I
MAENHDTEGFPKTFAGKKIKDGMELCSEASAWIDTLQHLTLMLENTENELIYARKWGDFNRETMDMLSQHGIRFLFYKVHERDFNAVWQEEYRLEILHEETPDIYFTIVLKDDEENNIPFSQAPVPAKSERQLEEEKSEILTSLKEIRSYVAWTGKYGIESLEQYKNQVEESYQLATAIHQSKTLLDTSVYMIQGFVPEDMESKISHFCTKANAVAIRQKVVPTDKAPVSLRNNTFAGLFENIGQLYSMPSYGEIDLTPFFAPFFMMFFGFCLGDAGYGVLIFISTFILQKRMGVAWASSLKLVRWLSLATIVFGIFTGTFFGINLLETERVWLQPFQKWMLDSNQMFNLALLIGLAQILFGMSLKAANQYKQSGWKYIVSPIAWIFLILALTDWFVFTKFPDISKYVFWVSCLLILFFNDPDAGFLSRIGKGIWELYGITGFVGDLLSYIRLFALGISSAILGMVINDIAVRLLEIHWIGWILFLIFLVIGHGANILIASLGAFVHPLRLTFVEFFKNAGFKGGGELYQPFRKIK